MAMLDGGSRIEAAAVLKPVRKSDCRKEKKMEEIFLAKRGK